MSNTSQTVTRSSRMQGCADRWPGTIVSRERSAESVLGIIVLWSNSESRVRRETAVDNCLVRYAGGRTHRKCGWSSCSTWVVVSSMRLRTRNSRSAARASSAVQCRTSRMIRRPSACRPCSVSTVPRFTSASQRSCSCSGDISQVYNAAVFNPVKRCSPFLGSTLRARKSSGRVSPELFQSIRRTQPLATAIAWFGSVE